MHWLVHSYDGRMNPRISIVIPVYQRGAELRRALRSLASQSCMNFEVLIADDGSNPPAEEVASEFRASLSIRCLALPHSGRPARPRNAAVAASRAEWISFLDSDDTWDMDRIAVLDSYLRDGVDVVHHRLRICCEPTRSPASRIGFRPRAVGSGFGRRSAVDHLASVGNTVAMSGATVRRDMLVSLGGFDEELPCNDDYDLWMRLALAGARFQYIDRVLGTYWTGGLSISGSGERGILARQRFREKYAQDLSPQFRRRMDARLDYMDAVAALSSGKYDAASFPALKFTEFPRYWIAIRVRRAASYATSLLPRPR